MTSSDWLITATPPTPNGDLHIGHISGPYLAADIFKRVRMVLGDNAVYVCYGDDNQSYILTTADRLGTDPIVLAEKGNADIQKTLRAYHIDMDQYTRPNEEHNKVVGDAIRLLINKNLIVEKETDQLSDSENGAILYEAFVSGYCNVCLLETKGGVCEACGHPNAPVNLLEKSFPNGSNVQFIRKSIRSLVLPIEDYREEIVEFYKTKRGKWRPHLIQLVDELLSKPLSDFPISHSGSWGIPIGLPEWDGHVINVWAEMGLGLLHLLNQHRSGVKMDEGIYVQFLGYDNSYFFAILHPVLQFALRRVGMDHTKLPEFIFTNEFYCLDNKKFSTSQGHVLWGRELLEHMSADEARLYLSLNSPELSEANFRLRNALNYITGKIRPSIKRIYNLTEKHGINHDISEINLIHPNVFERIKFWCQPENFSSRRLASILDSMLAFVNCAEDEISREMWLELSPSLLLLLNVIMPNTYQKLQKIDEVKEIQ